MIYLIFFSQVFHKLFLSQFHPPRQPTPFRSEDLPYCFVVENIEVIRSEYPDFSNTKFVSIHTHFLSVLSSRPKGRPIPSCHKGPSLHWSLDLISQESCSERFSLSLLCLFLCTFFISNSIQHFLISSILKKSSISSFDPISPFLLPISLLLFLTKTFQNPFTLGS